MIGSETLRNSNVAEAQSWEGERGDAMKQKQHEVSLSLRCSARAPPTLVTFAKLNCSSSTQSPKS